MLLGPLVGSMYYHYSGSSLLLCSLDSFLCVNARLLVPFCGMCGFPWVIPLVGLVHLPWCGIFLFGILGCLARVVVWFYVVSLLVSLYVGSGLDWLSFARGVGLVIFGWLAYWQHFEFATG